MNAIIVVLIVATAIVLFATITAITLGILKITEHIISGRKPKIDLKKYKSKCVVILTDDEELLEPEYNPDTTTLVIDSLVFTKDKKFIASDEKWIHIDNILDIDEVKK